jgi:hypothetical protein
MNPCPLRWTAWLISATVSDLRPLPEDVGRDALGKGKSSFIISPLAPWEVSELDELQSGDPRRIGSYWIEARLGSGGMGRVYLGRSPGGRHVAIKAIRAELAENVDFRARFAREVSAARKVSGIFTAPVVDADLDGLVPWLATSYVAGPSLADAVVVSGVLSAASVLKLAAGLAEGLEAIHGAGVVHRDLKPSNVILAEDGPRLIDFGISRSAETSALTHTGMVVGSPGFMSPEQAEGREVGPPSDIFSLGAVLAFAATGEGPFGEGSTAALVYRVVYSEPNTDELPDEIRPLIERCLAKDPQHRATAAELLAELSTAQPSGYPPSEPAIPGLPGNGLAGPAPNGAAKAVAQLPHPATRRVAAPELLRDTSAGGPTVTAPHLHPAHHGRVAELHPAYDGRVAEVERHRPFRRGWLIVAAVIVLAAAGAGAFLAGRAGHVSGHASAASNSSHQASPTSSASNPSPATQPPGAATMAALGSYLAQSASVRPIVQPAIDRVQSCSGSPSSGEATLQQAITTRQHILAGLQSLSPSSLPNGAQLIGALTTAMQNSINADQDYQNWMADFASSGNPCGSDPNQDPNYVVGQNASTEATTAKNAFVGTWNPMASRYGQKSYSSTDF